MTDRRAHIEAKLQDALQPEYLQVEDQSHLHVGHVGAQDGQGHYHITLVSAIFNGKNRLARHRQVYAALGDLMQTDIHALGIDAYSPDEFGK